MIAKCSTTGCSRTHDAACEPCGHAACCWECLDQINKHHGKCPVCAVKIIDITRCYETHATSIPVAAAAGMRLPHHRYSSSFVL